MWGPEAVSLTSLWAGGKDRAGHRASDQSRLRPLGVLVGRVPSGRLRPHDRGTSGALVICRPRRALRRKWSADDPLDGVIMGVAGGPVGTARCVARRRWMHDGLMRGLAVRATIDRTARSRCETWER
jgi:hypothetical protein